MDIILKNLTEEQFDLLSMAVDGSLGYSLTDKNNDTQSVRLITQLQAIRESILEFRASILTDEDMNEMRAMADSCELYNSQLEIFDEHLAVSDVFVNFNTHH